MFSNHETANVRLFRVPLQVPFDMFARPCCSSPVCSGSSLPACVPRRSSSSISRHASPEQTTATPRMGNSAETPVSRAASPMLPCFQSLSPHTDPPPTALARTSGEVDATATSPTLPLLTQNDAHLANQLSTLPSDSLPCDLAALSIVRESQPPRPNATSFATSTACSPPMSLDVQTSTSPAISAASPAIASLPSPPAAHPTETQHLGRPAGATTGAAAALPFFTKNDAPIAAHLFSLPKHSLARAAQTPPTPIPHPPTQRRCFELVSGVVHSLCEEATLPFFTPNDAPFATRLFAIPTTSRAHLAPAVHESPSKAFRSHPSNPFAGYRKHCVVSSTQLLPAKPLHMHKKSETIRFSVYERPRKIKSSAILPKFHQRLGWNHLLPLPTAGGVLLPLPRAAG